MSPQVHAGDAVTSVGHQRGEEAIGATDVSHAWRQHHQWPISDHVEGDAPPVVVYIFGLTRSINHFFLLSSWPLVEHFVRPGAVLASSVDQLAGWACFRSCLVPMVAAAMTARTTKPAAAMMPPASAS
jgi:hypothetical protein